MLSTRWMYIIGIAVLIIALLLDLGIFNKKNKKISVKAALYQSIFWVGLSLAFWIFVWYERGEMPGIKFISAYLMEKSLSIDNIFVFILIFSAFRVDEENIGRALFIGVLLAIVLRIVFIALGVELINRFHWLLYIFGAFLIYTGIKLFFKKEEEEYDPEKTLIYRMIRKFFPVTNQALPGKYFVRINRKLYLTPLTIVIILLAATDIVFAVDSIPTVVSLVKESAETPFTPDDILVIYSSNIFAVLGLRSLFFLLKGAINEFDYIQQGIAIVLAFIGVKMLIEIFDVHISIYISLIVIVVAIAGSMIYSHYHKRKGITESEKSSL